MIFYLSAHPIMISAHASIHADSLKNMRTDDAQDHSVSILLTFSLIFSPSSLLLYFFLLNTDYAFVNLQCKQSLLAHSLLIYSPSVHTGPFDAVCPWGGQNLRGSWGHRCPLAYPLYCPRHAHGREWQSVLQRGNKAASNRK